MEQIAEVAPHYRGRIAALLASFVRQEAPWPPSRPLREVDVLTGATLTGADFTGADFTGAELEGTAGVSADRDADSRRGSRHGPNQGEAERSPSRAPAS
jgi:hypothetical protein